MMPMFNTNVSEMPIEIFADYSSDMLGEEWMWEYIVPMLNGIVFHDKHHVQGQGSGGFTESGAGDEFDYRKLFIRCFQVSACGSGHYVQSVYGCGAACGEEGSGNGNEYHEY